MKKYFTFLLISVIFISCNKTPRICKLDTNPEMYILTLSYNNEGKQTTFVKNQALINFIKDESCHMEHKFKLSANGDLWHLKITPIPYIEESLDLTKTSLGVLYFRDSKGTYKNDILAKKLIEITGVN